MVAVTHGIGVMLPVTAPAPVVLDLARSAEAAGARGPRSFAVAGRVADGLVLAGLSGPGQRPSCRTIAGDARALRRGIACWREAGSDVVLDPLSLANLDAALHLDDLGSAAR